MSVEHLTAVMKLPVSSPGEKLLLLIFANYADELGRSYPSQKTLSDYTSMSVRTISTHMASLEDRGLIRKQIRHNPSGKRISDLIYLQIDNMQISPVAKSATGKISMSSPAKSSGNTKEDTKVNTPIPPQVLARKEAFDYYNERAAGAGVPIAKELGKSRVGRMNATLDRLGGLEGWKTAVDRAMAIPGLTGADGGWRMSIDTLLTESKMTKLLEGFYDRWGKPAEAAAPPMNARERRYYEENLKKLREGQGAGA